MHPMRAPATSAFLIRTVSLLMLALLASASQLRTADAASSATADSDASATAAPAATGQRFVDAINAADGMALNALIDVDALGARVLRNLELNAVDRVRYLASLRTQHGLLGVSVAAQMGAQNARAALARASTSGADGPLVRVTTRDARGNLAHGYLQLELGDDGRIVDWYDHGLAQRMSGQLAFSAAGMLTSAELAQMLFGDVDDAVATSRGMHRLATLLAVGAMAEAHEVLMSLPESVQAQRDFATLRVTLARHVGMDAYRDAMADLARQHGDADELQFILIDHHLLGGRPEQALRAVDRAARLVGDDEVMEANRCHALLELDRIAEALAACDRAIALAPSFETPRWTRVRLALKTENAPLAIESLEGVEAAQGSRLEAGWMHERPIYAWLVQQPEFAAWAAERGGSTEPAAE